MKDPINPLFRIIGMAGLLGYFGAIIYAGVESLRTDGPPEIPEILTFVVTSVGGILATFWGALLAVYRSRKPPSPGSSDGKFTKIQVIAAYGFIIALATGTLFWIVDGLSENSAVILRNCAYTLVGTIVGVLAVMLNVDPPPPPGPLTGREAS